MTTSQPSNRFGRTIIGLPVMFSVVAAWFVVHLRHRSARHRTDELASEGAYLDDPSSDVEIDDLDAGFDEATAVLLG